MDEPIEQSDPSSRRSGACANNLVRKRTVARGVIAAASHEPGAMNRWRSMFCRLLFLNLLTYLHVLCRL